MTGVSEGGRLLKGKKGDIRKEEVATGDQAGKKFPGGIWMGDSYSVLRTRRRKIKSTSHGSRVVDAADDHGDPAREVRNRRWAS